MWFPYRQRWLLWRTGCRLRRSYPQLAVMLAIFTRLTAGEAITSREQHRSADGRMRRSLARLGRVLAATAAWLSAGARRAGRRLRYAGAALRSRFSGSVRKSVGFPPVAGHPGDSK
jgi:hypothetical protein